MARTIGPVTATSARWKVMARAWRTTRAPILISFSCRLVIDQSAILAVPARRYGELVETFRGLAFDAEGEAEASFAGHRLIVAHDPLRAAE